MEMPTSKPRLLVVGQEAREKTSPHHPVHGNDFDIDHASSAPAALARLEEHPADLILAALDLEGMTVAEFLAILKAREPDSVVVVIGPATEQHALVEATRRGASGYVTTPTTASLLSYELERVLSHRNLRLEAEHLRRQMRERSAGGLGTLIGTSSAMQYVYQTVQRAASCTAPWLISGESGAGKRTLAHMVHARSRRAAQPLVSFRTLGEADDGAFERLFGLHGSLAAAEGGTLVVEHVGTLAPALQLGLLHVLEHKIIETHTHPARPVDVRVIATASVDPRRDVQAGRLREDLYGWLRTVHVAMPPLRERGNDVLLLAEYFLKRGAEANHRLVHDLDRLARAKLASHNWPGNVRSLEQVIESAVMQCEGSSLAASDLGFEPDVSPVDKPRIPGSTMADIEKHVILQTLDSVAGSTVRAAEILDMSVRTIQYRLHEYGITPKRKESRPSHA